MLKSVSNRNSMLACLADCPADNHSHKLAQFLYETSDCLKTFKMKKMGNLNINSLKFPLLLQFKKHL